MEAGEKNKERIEELKQELKEKHGISTDRDLVKKLGIVKEEDKAALFVWIRYQGAYEYRDGYDNGREDLKRDIADFIKPNR